MRSLPLIALLLFAGVLPAGCGEEKEGGDDTGAGDAASGDLCEGAPVVTWDNFGQSFLTENCRSCHASTSLNRNGAPEDVTFDTREQALALQDRILERAAGPEPTMPPEGGVHPDDRYLLEVWLTCWE